MNDYMLRDIGLVRTEDEELARLHSLIPPPRRRADAGG
jgi:hypothetical protein